MNDHDILLAIQEELDGTVWTLDTLSRIAVILINAGYRIRDKHDADLEA